MDPENEKLWVGKRETHDPITAAVALSGLAAECWVENPETSADEIADWIDDRLVSPSATDEAQFPTSYEGKLAAVVESLSLLQKHKAFFDWAVEQLIDAEVITDGMAAEKFRQLYG
jgi:hypothetical protein